MTDKDAGVEFAGLENDGLENNGLEQEQTYVAENVSKSKATTYLY